MWDWDYRDATVPFSASRLHGPQVLGGGILKSACTEQTSGGGKIDFATSFSQITFLPQSDIRTEGLIGLFCMAQKSGGAFCCYSRSLVGFFACPVLKVHVSPPALAYARIY